MAGARASGCEGEGNGEFIINGDRVSVQEGEKFWRWVTVTAAQRECT